MTLDTERPWWRNTGKLILSEAMAGELNSILSERYHQLYEEYKAAREDGTATVSMKNRLNRLHKLRRANYDVMRHQGWVE